MGKIPTFAKEPVFCNSSPWEAELLRWFFVPFPIYKKQLIAIRETKATPLCDLHDQMQPNEGEFQLQNVILI